MKTRPLQIAWARFLPPPEAEKDPGFRSVILRQTKNGMAGLGLLGIVSVLLFISVRTFSAESFEWNYSQISDGVVVLWDKIAIVGLSAACLLLSRTSFGPRSGRLLVGVLAIAASVALLLDDLGTGDLSFSPAYLALVMLGAVGTMPYRPGQILGLCLAITGVYILFISWHATLQGYSWWTIDPTRARFLVIVTPICTIIAALIYSSRYELYKSRSRAEKLKADLHSQSKTMIKLERDKARELAESYRKLKKMQAQIVHQGKMASLGRLTAGIAHEIQNPLNFVVNYAQLSSEMTELLMSTISSNYEKRIGDLAGELSATLVDLQHNAQKIDIHGQRAASIVRNMLLHSRSASGERKHVDFNALVEEYVKLAYHGMRAQHAGFDVVIEDDYHDGVGMVELVPQEIGRVIINLLDNAFYALEQKAASLGDSFEPTVQVSTRRVDDSVELRIRDNGPGLADDTRTKIFEPFYTTKPAGSGTGLGLSLSYDIVTQGHGGTLHVESKKGEHAAFVVSLPLQSSVQVEDATAIERLG